MTETVEREIKLAYPSVTAARRAVTGVGATPLHPRRLQNDYLLDRETDPLSDRRCTLRVRSDGNHARVTFKGPPLPGPTKARREIETAIGDPELVIRLFERLGFRVWFRYQKYREEYRHDGLVIAIDEAPIGVFVELEGDEPAVLDMATTLGRERADFILDSYRALFVRHVERTGSRATDMLFEPR